MTRILEEGPKGFKGGLNAKKYIGITDASKATATRDLQDLVEKGALVPYGGGRSTRYEADLEGVIGGRVGLERHNALLRNRVFQRLIGMP